MKMNKNQALYKALPNCWITYSDSKKSDYKYSCRVMNWNIKTIFNINKDMLRNDVLKKVSHFSKAGGIVYDDLSQQAIDQMDFVEPVMNEGIPDVTCKISPQTYYCEKCGVVEVLPDSSISAPMCKKCHQKMKQLQLAYACECGYADGVRPKFSKYNKALWFFPNTNAFKFFDEHKKAVEMHEQCPICKKQLSPRNAVDKKLFYSQTGNLVNLFNKKYSDILNDYKFDAELLMFGKWFKLLDNDKFDQILDEPKKFFERAPIDVDNPEVQRLAKIFGMSPEMVAAKMAAEEGNALSIDNLKHDINQIIDIQSLGINIKSFSTDLLEFDTLKNAKGVITLDRALERAIELKAIVDKEQVISLLKEMSIKEIQVSESVQIVNYAYGFTRLRSCPAEGGAGSLRLNGFGGKAYTSILETEGILFEMDLKAIYQWLVDNEIVKDDLVFDNENQLKAWFLENINADSINHFSSIESSDGNLVTKTVYSLLHTISHMMIISAGKHSGLSKDSLSELIFPETGSFFIYPTSNEGITLGSISGMFESDLRLFLEDGQKDNEICAFDPICSTTQNGACLACSYLGEVSCTHFNKDLSRSYLYGGVIKTETRDIVIKKGFWK